MVLAVASLLTHLKSIERGVVLIDATTSAAPTALRSLSRRCATAWPSGRLQSARRRSVLDHGEQRAWPLGEFAVLHA